ncbi:MAG: RNA polymerase sigma factor [Erysipelotrichaceae bacterium]
MDLEQLYELYFSRVYRFIRKLSGNESIAEEVTSDTFFYAIEHIEQFRGDCDLSVWLCQIAKRRYYDLLKRNKKFIQMEEQQWAQLVVEQDVEVWNDSQQKQWIKTGVHLLTAPYKEVLMWRVFAELSFKQIGQIFGKSDNWACVTYYRAKQQLRTK